jgi:hypothetical protein
MEVTFLVIEKFLHTFIFLSYKILCIVSDMYSAPYKRITSSTLILHCLLFWKKEITLFVPDMMQIVNEAVQIPPLCSCSSIFIVQS